MKFKTSIIGEDWGYYEILDETDFYDDVVFGEGQEEASRFFKCGTFEPNEIHHHYINGFLDYLGQSDHCPMNFYDKKIVSYILERVDDQKVIKSSYDIAFCPVCKGSVWQNKDESKYCFRCGQKLNWI